MATIGSFLAAAISAAGLWYLTMLATLWVGNGRLRLRTDVLAIGIGAVLIGVPVAMTITGVVAVPAYFIVKRFDQVCLSRAVIGGACIGLLFALTYWTLAHQWDVITPLQAAVVGAGSGAVWWHVWSRQMPVQL